MLQQNKIPGIGAVTINKLLKVAGEALDCELDELIIRVPNKESSITHTRQGTQKSNDK